MMMRKIEGHKMRWEVGEREKILQRRFESGSMREKNDYREGLREEGCMGQRKHDVRKMRKKK